LVLREVDVALEVGRDRGELAEEVDRELAGVVAGFGSGRDGEQKTAASADAAAITVLFSTGPTLLPAAWRGRGDRILDRRDPGGIQAPWLVHADLLVQIP
jgi:hypothetical protein